MDPLAPQPNQLIPVPVGTAISPLLQPFVTPKPLFQPASATPNPAFQLARPTQQSSPIRRFQPTAPAVDTNYQRNLTTLQNKYRDLSPLMARTSPTVRNALVSLDSQRVARGASPLTREQTVLAIQTAETNQQATPQPHRNPWNVLGNIGSDLSDVLKMFTPEGVRGLVHEVTDIPHVAQRIQENEQAGMSPFQAFLRAPGIRLIPGTYTAANILGGREGISEALSHPLMTALDLLPAADKLAGGSAIAEATQEARVAQAEALGGHAPRPHPISAVLNNRLTPEGELVRSPLGAMVDTFRNETRLGQALDSFGGARSRGVSRMAGRLDQRLKSLALGFGKPENVVESFLPRVNDLFERYSDQYPFLAKNAVGPEAVAARAEFVATIQRHPETLDPAFVNEYRDLRIDMARYAQGEGLLGMHDGEWYPTATAEGLRRSEARVTHGQRMIGFYNEYVNPSGHLDAPAFQRMADDVASITDKGQKAEAARALENTLDAYGIGPALLRGERTKISWPSWRAKLDTLLNEPGTPIHEYSHLDDQRKMVRDYDNGGETIGNIQTSPGVWQAIDHFDALPDDALVTVYHGTTRAAADDILKNKRVDASKVGSNTGATKPMPGDLYLAPTYESARAYGDTVVSFRIRKGDMGRPMEIMSPTGSRADLGYAFFDPIDHGAVSANPTKWLDPRIVTERRSAAATRLAPRRSMADIVKQLRAEGADRQAILLEQAVKDGDRATVSRTLHNLSERKVTNVATDPEFRADVASMARRTDFENTVGRKYSTERVESRRRVYNQIRDQAAPARFDALLSDTLHEQTPGRLRAAAENKLGRTLTNEEAGRLARAVEQKVWSDTPGLDPIEVARTMNQLEREVTATWRELRDAGANPEYVHKVSPGRLNTTLHNRIGPVPNGISQAKERVLDLSPTANDLQVSLTHQATELLSRKYSEQFIHQVIDAVGVPEAELRRRYMDEAQRRGTALLDAEAQYQKLRDNAYTRFNPDSEGYSWGGANMQKYRDDVVFIPKSIANNLKRYVKTPSIFTAVAEPLTGLFRYQVIGLSPSVVINNFFSNAVAAIAENGPRFLTKWNEAQRMLKDIGAIDSEELKGMLAAEEPFMEKYGREQAMAMRTSRVESGVNARHAFQDSVYARTAGTVKNKLDAVVHQTMKAQRWGDNVYRSMIYLDQLEHGIKKGLTSEAAENAAMEQVRRTLVDYSSFTPVERSAMRTLVPFYSYMGHAARFIARYPLDHPLRASIAGSIARAERERLGALPGSFLSMLPITGIAASGAQTFLNLRPFDPFGDQGDLLSVAGWLSAMNPAIQIALQQVGVVRGESDLYPTLRYDPETGRMVAVHPSLLANVFNTVVPRAGLVTAALGINSQYNQIKANDPAAANRSLLSMAGLPRAWRQYNVPQEGMRAEVNREQAATDVLNNAIRSGDWSEALRYPSLQAYYDQIRQLSPDQIAAMTPASPDQIAQGVS